MYIEHILEVPCYFTDLCTLSYSSLIQYIFLSCLDRAKLLLVSVKEEKFLSIFQDPGQKSWISEVTKELRNFCYLSANDKQYHDSRHLKGSSHAKYSSCLCVRVALCSVYIKYRVENEEWFLMLESLRPVIDRRCSASSICATTLDSSTWHPCQ